MKKGLITLVSVMSILFCACNDSSDEYSKMSLVELNNEYNSLLNEYNEEKQRYDILTKKRLCQYKI